MLMVYGFRLLVGEELFARLISYLELNQNAEANRKVRNLLNLSVSTVIVSTEGEMDTTAYTNVFDRIALSLILDHSDPPDAK